MNTFARTATETEASFIDGVEANFKQALPGHFNATGWTTTHPSQDDKVRDAMRRAGVLDRNVLEQLPRNRSVVMTGTRPRFFFGRKTVVRAIASVISPIEHLLKEEAPFPPAATGDVQAHLDEIVLDRSVRCVVGLYSTSGFEDEVWASLSVPAGMTLVLVTRRDDGGWKTHVVGDNTDPGVARWFDPEAMHQKIRRIERAIADAGAELLGSGVSAAQIAAALQLPEELVHLTFRQRARSDPSLTVTKQSGDTILYKTSVTEPETSSMSMADRIRSLFGRRGEEARKIRELTERRVQLAQRRDRMYDDMARLEQRESELVGKGRASDTDAAKKRLVPQIKAVRNDIQRHTATVRMLDRQIDIINTDIHNLTMIQQGKQAKLPTTDELTDHAVKAEEMLEQLAADADLTGSLAVGVEDETLSGEEADILAELSAETPRRQETPAEESQESPLPEEPAQPEKREPEAG